MSQKTKIYRTNKIKKHRGKNNIFIFKLPYTKRKNDVVWTAFGYVFKCKTNIQKKNVHIFFGGFFNIIVFFAEKREMQQFLKL